MGFQRPTTAWVQAGQEVRHRCERCGTSYHWMRPLVVDGRDSSRMAAADEGNLLRHDCPGCGARSFARGPIMFFFHDREPPCLFSPDPLTTRAQAMGHFRSLVDQAREQLGMRWRDEWGEGVPVVERSELPVELFPADEALRDEMRPMLEPLLGAASREEARDWVLEHPALLTARAEAALDDFIRIVRVEGTPELRWHCRFIRELLHRCRRQGIDAGFELRQDEVRPLPGEVRLPLRLVPFLQTYDDALDGWEDGDPAAVDRGIAGMTRFFSELRPGEVDPDFEADAHKRIADLYLMRHQARGEASDLDDAIVQLERAVAFGVVGELAAPLRVYASAVLRRYGRDGNEEDLELAIAVARRAVNAAWYLPELTRTRVVATGVLVEGFKRWGDPELVAEALEYVEAAAAAGLEAPSEAGDALGAIGRAARQGYIDTGSIELLDTAIDAYSRALDFEPTRASLHLGLSGCLLDRHSATGDAAALARAAKTAARALEGLAEDAPELPGLLVNRSAALLEDGVNPAAGTVLDGVIDDLERAVRTAPPGWPDLSLALSNLGLALLRRSRKGDRQRAMRVLRRATEVPMDDVDRIRSRLNLASTLPDLEAEGTALLQELADTVPTSSSLRPAVLYNLAQREMEAGGDGGEARAILLMRDAARAALDGNFPVALAAGITWGKWTARRGDWAQAVEGFGVATEALDLLLSLQAERAATESWLAEAPFLSAAHAVALARVGEPGAAVEAAEAGLARMAGAAADRVRLGVRARRDRGAAAVAERLAEAERRLARAIQGDGGSTPGGGPRPQHGEVWSAREGLAAATAEVRDLPGLGRFGTRLAFEEIRVAAAHAPLVYLVDAQEGACALIVEAHAPQPRLVWLGDQGRLNLLEDLKPCISALDSKRPDLHRGFDRAGRRLWEVVMGPVLDALGGAEEAVFIPDGFLALFPLHLAWTPDPHAATGRRYVLDVLRCRYSPNGRLLLEPPVGGEAAGPWVGIDRPAPSALPPLGFGAEASFARACLPEGTLLRGRKATVDAVVSALAGASVAHFVCHGMWDFKQPLENALVLAHDQPLSVRMLLEEQAPPLRLAVLSACGTGQRGLHLLQESVGLPAALLQAGVGGVVATMWEVADLSATLLMVRFYHEWTTSRMHPAEALRRAQRWLRDTPAAEIRDWFERAARERALREREIDAVLERFEDTQDDHRAFEHPYHWAPYVYFGS